MSLTIQELEQKLTKLLAAENVGGLGPQDELSVREVLTSKDASILFPRVIQGAMRRAAEPLYLGTKLMRRINVKDTYKVEFPSVGVMRAFDIPEGAPYPIQHLDIQRHQASTEIKTGKVGLLVPITEEAIQRSQWEVMGMHFEEAGRALARRKEEKVFNEFITHGWTVFDNSLRAQYPEAGTRGRNDAGELNDTAAVEDIIDMYASLVLNGFQPTDVILHPLTMPIFWQNSIIGIFGQAALGGYGVNWNGTNFPAPPLRIDPENVQGRLPVAINVLFSPFMPFDFRTRRFCIVMIDRSEVGVIVVNTDVVVEEFSQPERDIRLIKAMERYGVGCLHSGRAIAVARNIAYELTYPKPPVVYTKQAA